MKKIAASVVGLSLAGALSAAKSRFAPWVNHFLNPQLKEVRMLKKILLLMSSVLLAYGLGVTPVLAETMSLWSREDNADQLRGLIDAWNETHKDQIELTLLSYGEMLSKLGLALAAGTAPDLAAIDGSRVPKFSSAGQLLDITDQAQALPYFDHFIKGDIEVATYPKVGGRLYGIPFFLDAAVLMWNKDLFRRAGLDPEKPPANRAEMKQMIEKITALGDDIYGFYFSGACAGCISFTGIPQIWASGGDVFNEDSSAMTFDDPEVKELLEFYHWMWTNEHVPASASADMAADFSTLFRAGKIGMQGMNAMSLTLIKNDHPDLDFGISYLPGREGGASSWVGGDTISITKDAKHPDLAWEFLEWLSSEEVQVKYYIGLNALPLRTDLFDHPDLAKDPRMVNAPTAGEVGRVPWSKDLSKVLSANTTPWATLLEEAIYDGVYDPETGNKETNEIISELE